jgi:hypothetical protein
MAIYQNAVGVRALFKRKSSRAIYMRKELIGSRRNGRQVRAAQLSFGHSSDQRAITSLSRAQPLDTEGSARTVERDSSGSDDAAAIAFRGFRLGCR